MTESRRPEKRGFARKGSVVVGIRLAGAVLAYAIVVLFARWLDPESYGHYTLIMSIVTLASVVSKLGLDLSLVRFLGRYRAENRPELAEGFVRIAMGSVLVTSLFIALSACAIILTFPNLIERPVPYAIAAFFLLPAFGLTDILSAIIRSSGGTFPALAPKDVLWRIGLIISTASIIYLTKSEGPKLVMIVLMSGIILSALTFWQFLVQKSLRRDNSGTGYVPEYEIGLWQKSAVWAWSSAVGRTSIRTLDVIAVGVILSPAAAGAYFAASRSAELLGFLLAAINMVVGPAVAHGTASGEIHETQKKLENVALALGISVPIFAIVFGIFGKDLLVLMSPGFANAYPSLLILAVGHSVNVLVGSSGIVLNMTGNERTNALILITSVPIPLLLFPILGPLLGMTGIAIAASVGLIVLNLRTYRAARRLTPYDPSIFSIRLLFAKDKL